MLYSKENHNDFVIACSNFKWLSPITTQAYRTLVEFVLLSTTPIQSVERNKETSYLFLLRPTLIDSLQVWKGNHIKDTNSNRTIQWWVSKFILIYISSLQTSFESNDDVFFIKFLQNSIDLFYSSKSVSFYFLLYRSSLNIKFKH